MRPGIGRSKRVRRAVPMKDQTSGLDIDSDNDTNQKNQEALESSESESDMRVRTVSNKQEKKRGALSEPAKRACKVRKTARHSTGVSIDFKESKESKESKELVDTGEELVMHDMAMNLLDNEDEEIVSQAVFFES